MGAVYKVRHRVLGKLRVIKTIRPQLQSDQDLQNRFLREAQVAAGLRHPNIAAVHDCAFTNNGTAYIVMEHIEGQNLRDYQRSGGRLSVEQVVEAGRQALDALGYLHSKSFVHRDISTDNMMISWHDGLPTVTLIDLGLAKSLESPHAPSPHPPRWNWWPGSPRAHWPSASSRSSSCSPSSAGPMPSSGDRCPISTK